MNGQIRKAYNIILVVKPRGRDCLGDKDIIGGRIKLSRTEVIFAWINPGVVVSLPMTDRDLVIPTCKI
jgi:hypothetical protein